MYAEQVDQNCLDPWTAMTSTSGKAGQAVDPCRLAEYGRLLEEADRNIGAFLAADPVRGGVLVSRRSGLPAESPFGALSPDAPCSLEGLPFGVKDNIAVETFPFTCGSRILEGLTAPYSATVVERLLAAGAVPVGKLNLDEFGMGSSTANSAWQRTLNPWDSSRVPGGSSGGSAAAVAAGLVPFALGSDTGGSVRQPAAFCGTYGLKPTYGRVSRYGLAAYASSLETIGVLADSIRRIRDVYLAISGIDSRDQTSVSPPGGHSLSSEEPITVGYLAPEAADSGSGLDPAIADALARTLQRMRSLGWKTREIAFATQEYAVPVYYTIAAAEASANLARYTGIRYGQRSRQAVSHEELVRRTRENGFGDEVKLRILLGTYVLRSGFQDQYYTRAQKIRTLIRREFETRFSEVDLILMPVFPTLAFRFDSEAMDPFQQKLADRYTVIANLAGIPALAFPTGPADGLPVGLQLMAPAFGEERLLRAAEALCGLSPIDYAPGFRPLPMSGTPDSAASQPASGGYREKGFPSGPLDREVHR